MILAILGSKWPFSAPSRAGPDQYLKEVYELLPRVAAHGNSSFMQLSVLFSYLLVGSECVQHQFCALFSHEVKVVFFSDVCAYDLVPYKRGRFSDSRGTSTLNH